jgi:hypothetical protein
MLGAPRWQWWWARGAPAEGASIWKAQIRIRLVPGPVEVLGCGRGGKPVRLAGRGHLPPGPSGGIGGALSPKKSPPTCLVCGRKPSDPHHLGFTQPRALGRKVSDEFAVPLCRGHRGAVHRSRDERAWWKQSGIDPIKIARRLWKETRGMGKGRAEPPVSPRPQGAAAASPDPRNEEMSTAARTQEETRLTDAAASLPRALDQQ